MSRISRKVVFIFKTSTNWSTHLVVSTARSFWRRASRVRSRFSGCVLFVMFVGALLVRFSFGLCRCGNFRAAALAGAGPWHVACARLSGCGVAGLSAARVARRLGQRQGAAKHNRTNEGPKFRHSFLLQGLFDASIAPGVRLGEHQNTQIGATWILKAHCWKLSANLT